MRWYICVKECMLGSLGLAKEKNDHVRGVQESIRAIREEAESKLREARASLNGEDGWFLELNRNKD